MKVNIVADEAYPVYSVSSVVGRPAEVPEGKLAEWQEAEAKWDAAQEEMARYYEGSPE